MFDVSVGFSIEQSESLSVRSVKQLLAIYGSSKDIKNLMLGILADICRSRSLLFESGAGQQLAGLLVLPGCHCSST